MFLLFWSFQRSAAKLIEAGPVTLRPGTICLLVRCTVRCRVKMHHTPETKNARYLVQAPWSTLDNGTANWHLSINNIEPDPSVFKKAKITIRNAA